MANLSSKVYIVNWNQVTNLSQYEWEFLKYWNVSQCNSVLMFWLDSPWPIQCLLKSPIEWIIWVADIQPNACRQPHTHTVLAQPGERYHTTHMPTNEQNVQLTKTTACPMHWMHVVLLCYTHLIGMCAHFWELSFGCHLAGKLIYIELLKIVWLNEGFHLKAPVVNDCNGNSHSDVLINLVCYGVWEWLTWIAFMWTFQTNEHEHFKWTLSIVLSKWSIISRSNYV